MKNSMSQFETEEAQQAGKDYQAKLAWGSVLRMAAESVLLQKLVQKTFTAEERQELYGEIEEYLQGPMTDSMLMSIEMGVKAVGKPEKLPETIALFEETKRMELLKIQRVCCEDTKEKL